MKRKTPEPAALRSASRRRPGRKPLPRSQKIAGDYLSVPMTIADKRLYVEMAERDGVSAAEYARQALAYYTTVRAAGGA